MALKTNYLLLRANIIVILLLAMEISFTAIAISQDYENEEDTSDSLQITPNSLSFGLDKQLNIYAFNFLMNYGINTDYGNLNFNQKFLGTAYSSNTNILQDDEDFNILYEYPTGEKFSLLGMSEYIQISNRGSNELNELRRMNLLLGARVKPSSYIHLDLLAGAEDNNQMGILSKGSVYKVLSTLKTFDLEGYQFSGSLNGELLSLNYERLSRSLNFSGNMIKNYDVFDMISANISYKIMDRYNAFRRDSDYLAVNSLDFAYSIEARFNDMLVSDVNFSFGLTDEINGLLRLTFAQNNIERYFKEYVKNDTRTGVRQFRNQLKVAVNPELVYNSDNYRQLFGLLYSFESDENRVQNSNNISDIEFNLIRSRTNELDNLTTILRLISKTNINLSKNDTLYFSGMTSITRFDTPSEANNSDRDEFLGLVSLSYGRRLSDITTFRIDAEGQFNHQVNLRAARSASNFWMRSIKFAPSVVIQTKSFFMRPQPYILANYTVYDFEGFAPGLRSFSLRQIGYNDSISLIIGRNLYLGTRFDLIYKETGTLFWDDFKEQPINGNLKIFFKFYTGYYDKNFNIALGARYFNLTQQTFRAATFINSDYKTESFAPEVIINADFISGATLRLNGWYEFQIINDTFRNEIPNIILNTSIKL